MQAADLGVLALGEHLAALPRLARLSQVRRVVALVLGDRPVRDVQHRVDGVVEQRDVVADEHERARQAGELAEQPALGGAVEVVRRLVEHHGAGPLVQDAHEVDAASLPTRERREVLEQQRLFEAEPRGEARHLALGDVAAPGGELRLEVAEPRDVGLGRGPPPSRRARRARRRRGGRARARESTWESPIGSTPSPRSTGTWGRWVNEPVRDDLAAVKCTCGGGRPSSTDSSEVLPAPLRPTIADLLAVGDHEGGVLDRGRGPRPRW